MTHDQEYSQENHDEDGPYADIAAAARANVEAARGLSTDDRMADLQAAVGNQRPSAASLPPTEAVRGAEDLPSLLTTNGSLAARLESLFARLREATSHLSGGIEPTSTEVPPVTEGPHMNVLHSLAERSHFLMSELERQVTHLRGVVGLDH